MKLCWSLSRCLTAAAVTMFCFPISGCSSIRNTLQLGDSQRDRGRMNVAALETAKCTVPGCAVPGCVHVTPPTGQLTPVPGSAAPLNGAGIHPVPGSIDGPVLFPQAIADQAPPAVERADREADSIAECRREAADLRRRLELMESELTSHQRSSETMHLAHSTMNAQLERVARDNLHLQTELRRLQAATERQHQSDIASLDALSQLIEQQMKRDGGSSRLSSSEIPDE